jgi:putative spermidine/putrescine transport system permease protein
MRSTNRRARRPFDPGRTLLFAWCALSYIFLLSPLIIVIGGSFSGGGENDYGAVTFPPVNPTLKWYFRIPSEQIHALGVSLALGLTSALIATAIGIPAALGLVRSNIRGKFVLAAIFRAPLQIPAVVSGFAFLQLYYLMLITFGVGLPGTFWGLLIGHVFIGIPYVVGAVTAILQRFDTRLEEAAMILGASPFRVMWRVTLPVILPGIYAGGLYAFMVSFADVPISIFLGSSSYTTYPVALFFALENDFNSAILASATLVILFSLIILLIAQKIIGLDALLRTGGGSGK